jgi:antibiotic biosynthesis monooxygenase (ABM) superfamily enzyme
MIKKSGYSKHSSKEVTEVICRNIAAGHEKDYDDWLERFMKSERQFPGYLGTTIIAPGGITSSVRYVINRFSDQVSLDTWENSEVALSLIDEVNKYSTLQSYWFGDMVYYTRHESYVPKWKMAIVSFIGAYCISSLASFVLRPFWIAAIVF